jgi:hypothetical protein
MLLRRLTRHLENQNWTAVWIDLLIVIVGVFIGIQVTGWNDARLSREREKTVLSALKQEFLAYERDITDLITFQVRQAYNFSVVTETLDADGPPQDPAAFEFALVSIPYGRPPPSTSGVLQELVVSGRLSELSDPELRREFAAYIAKRDRVYDNILRVNATMSNLNIQTPVPFVAELVPSQRLAALLESGNAASAEHASTLVFPSGSVVGVRSYDLEAMRADPGIRRAFVTAYDAKLASSSWLRSLAADTRRLSDRLDESGY